MWTVLRRIGGEESVSVVQYAGDKKYLMQLGVSASLSCGENSHAMGVWLPSV